MFCCAGDRVFVDAAYTGVCPASSFIQADMADELGLCALCDEGGACGDLCNIDGVGAPVVCAGGRCAGYYFLPAGIYAITEPNCQGQVAYPNAAAIYEGGLPCDGGRQMDAINTNIGETLGGSIVLGTEGECKQMCTARQ